MLPEEVRAALTARIAAIPVGTYTHDANDAWRECAEPLVPERNPSNAQHLAFFVDDRDLDDTQARQSTPDDEPEVRAPIVVRFLFAVRPHDPKTDWDGAGRAATHVLRELLVEGWSSQLTVNAGASRLITRTPVGRGAWLRVEVRVVVRYILSLAQQP
jgi:hypothetical protein